MEGISSFLDQNQSKTLEETLKEAKEEKDDAETLDEKIKKAERQIIKTQFKYKVYATAIRSAYEKVEEVDPKSIPLLGGLIEAMERIPTLDIELKTFILDNITTYINEEIIFGESYRREKNIQNLRRGIEILTNEKGLRKINELYSLTLDGKIPLRDFDEYLEEVRDWAYGNSLTLDRETEIRYARQKVAYDYLKVIIKGLLIDPTKYEPLYKQLIETDNLGEFVKHLPKYI
jgi:hypothetical protein